MKKTNTKNGKNGTDVRRSAETPLRETEAVEDLASVERLFDRKVVCEFTVGAEMENAGTDKAGRALMRPKPGTGRLVRFTGRRLRPHESQQYRLMATQALPPVIPAKVDGDGKVIEPEQYDFRNPEYQRRLEECKSQARAVALWAGYPQFREKAEKEVSSLKFQVSSGEGTPHPQPLSPSLKSSDAERVAPNEGRDARQRVPATIEEITAFIEGGALDEDALNWMLAQLMRSFVTVESAASFF